VVIMGRLRALALALVVAVSPYPPALADEIEATLEAALEAYRAGDIDAAKEEADFAAALLAERKAAGLSDFLPKPFEGWSRTEGDAPAGAPAMFGGGLMASAVYSGPPGDIEMTLMADNPLVASMGAMFSSPQLMAMQGEVRRVGRQRYVVTADGEITALVGNRILVQLSGSAPEAEKIAYFEAVDFAGLSDF
jgi:hypothetical protein